ncbi:MAG: glycosyltransferase involved in cell wall biosynthesis [Flavobacteriales bacterium]|jgi:glycosyltransferase involved in cell wall biosynthesis
MKIIHILHSLKFSGAEIMYVDAAPFFQNKGCDLSVLATANEVGEYAPFFKNAGYEVLHNPIPQFKNIFKRVRYYIWFTKLLKRDQFDVVHIHSNSTMLGLSFCAWFVNIKSVFTYHSTYKTRLLSYPYHLFVRWCAKSIFKCKFQSISDTVYDHELNLFHNKTNKIYNWYGTNRFYPALELEKEKMRKDLGINADTFVLISIGGCSVNKQHSDIIKAMPIILDKNKNTLYLHLGCGSSEADEVKLCKDLGIEDNVRFFGNQVDIRKYLIASDVYLMTSKLEGISLTTIEAMACNIPAILYDVPGLRDFNKYGNNSILIAENYKLLAEAVFNYNTSTSDINIQAIKHVNQFYNLDTNANQIYNLYV